MKSILFYYFLMKFFYSIKGNPYQKIVMSLSLKEASGTFGNYALFQVITYISPFQEQIIYTLLNSFN